MQQNNQSKAHDSQTKIVWHVSSPVCYDDNSRYAYLKYFARGFLKSSSMSASWLESYHPKTSVSFRKTSTKVDLWYKVGNYLVAGMDKLDDEQEKTKGVKAHCSTQS